MKKQTLSKQEQYNKIHTRNRLKRRQEELARREAEAKKRDEIDFRRRVRSASGKKAPVTSRTKAYYGFSKEYPGNVDTNGFRENAERKKKLSVPGKLLVFVLCAAVLCLAYFGAKTALFISDREPESYGGSVAEKGDAGLTAYHFTFSELKQMTAGDITAVLEKAGCNAAVFEFKGEDGKINFSARINTPAVQPPEDESGMAVTEENTGEEPATEATNATESPEWTVIDELEKAGIKTIAYVSCYKDNFKPVNEPSLAVVDYDDPSTALSDNKGNLWLDPYSPRVTEYLMGILKRAADGGFSYVLIDNVCRPTDLGLKTAYYPASADSDTTLNNAFRLFLINAMNNVGKDRLILMCDPYGFISDKDDITGRYGGELMTSGVNAFAIDARLSYCLTKTDSDPEGIYTYINDMPAVTVLDSFTLSLSAVKEAEPPLKCSMWACVEYNEDRDTLDRLLNSSGCANRIIW